MTSELRRRVAFTIGALLVYRLGTHIPVPGIDSSALAMLFRSPAGGILRGFDLFSGGAVSRLAIFALGITPYLSAAIIMQLLTIMVPRLKALKRHGDRGRAAINDYTWYLAILLLVFQAYGLALGLESVSGLLPDAGALFRVSTVLTLVGGSLFLMWLAEQISARGVGNGIAVILMVGIVTQLPAELALVIEFGGRDVPTSNIVLGAAALLVGLTALIALMEGARRLIPIESSERAIGARTIKGRSDLRIKLNSAGIMPTIIVAWLLLIPALIGHWSGDHFGWWGRVAEEIERGRPLYLICYVALIVICVVVYTALIFDPDAAAADLQRFGFGIPGVAAGEATAEHVDHVLSRITLLGAAYLAFVYLVPELLITYAQVPFYLGGASLLIVVCTVLDLQSQIRGYATIKFGGGRP